MSELRSILTEKLDAILTDDEFNNIKNKEGLLEVLKEGKDVEFGWKIIYSVVVFDVTCGGAEMYSNYDVADMDYDRTEFTGDWQVVE